MKLVFISYWGIDDGLTKATVIPHLEILAKFETVEKLIFCSVERGSNYKTNLSINKVTHVPLFSRSFDSGLLTKLSDFTSFTSKIADLCNENGIDIIFCRSSLGGALGYLVSRRLKIPYIVESFEPHADYMVESGVWQNYDPRFLIQRFLEKKQKQTAKLLLPVSNHYAKRLEQEKVDKRKIIVMPCCVSLEYFQLNIETRNKVRRQLKIQPHEVVGIYVGKFGGMYYEDKAFDLYKHASNFFGASFRLIILTVNRREEIVDALSKRGVPTEKVFIKLAESEEVKDYLSASDFAFVTYKPSPSKKYLSPIKIGEYWANGLPILIEPGIGDESDIVEKEGGGVIIDQSNPEVAFQKLQHLLKKGRHYIAGDIAQLAYKYRRIEIVELVYKEILRKDYSTSLN